VEMKTSPHERKAWRGSKRDQKTAHEEPLLKRRQSSERNRPHREGLNTAAPSWEACRHGVLRVQSIENKHLDRKCNDERVFTLVYSQSMVVVPDQEAMAFTPSTIIFMPFRMLSNWAWTFYHI
jgi:hypothetical protein